MKLLGIFRFEVAYQLRRAWPWLIFVVVLVLSFLMARDATLADALYEDFYANSSFNVAKTTVFGGLIWLLLGAVVAGEAAARDVATGMHPLVYTSPISKTEYLGGRFLAALAVNALLLLGAQIGTLLAVYAPGVDPRVIGPFRPAAFLTAYAFIALPNIFAGTALQFALASRLGRPMAAYAGSLLLFFTSFFLASLVLYKRTLGSLLDPIGVRFIWEDLAHEWTTIEKSQRMLALEGRFLENRLLWLGIGVVALTLTYLRFRFEHRAARRSWWKKTAVIPSEARVIPSEASGYARQRVLISRSNPKRIPRFAQNDRLLVAQQTLSTAWDSFSASARSWVGIGMLVILPLMSIPIVLDQMSPVGTPLVPKTALVVAELTGPLSAQASRWLIVPLLLVFFAGELVWRERDAGMSEISDAMPGSEWAPLLGKFLGLALLLVVFQALLMAAGILSQSILSYHHFEIGFYIKTLFGLQLLEYLLFAALALAIHVMVNQKYVGHVVATMAYVFMVVLAGMLGIEHNLLVYAAGPRWSYTEMLGFDGTIMPWLWFKLYWAAWAALLVVAARLLWVRGREHGLGTRLSLARARFTGGTLALTIACVVLIASLGGFVYYNTNVLNEYASSSEVAELRAEYERRYGRYENAPQPSLVGVALRIELYPERREARARGTYRLVNNTAVAIDTIHVATSASGVATDSLGFDRIAKLMVDDKQVGQRIYDLEKPLQPGDTLRLDFTARYATRGFRNQGLDPAVTPSGSAFTSERWFPQIGYQRFRGLLGPAARREHGLEARPVLGTLEGDDAHVTPTLGGGVAFEAVVGTSDDQVAVAPGALRRTWSEGGRRYFQYSTDAPIGNQWSFFSARYATNTARWTPAADDDARAGVDIQIFHHPAHTAHLDRVVRAARASLDYYTTHFGPYPYGHLTFVEHPGASGFSAHADPSIISHGESFPSWIPEDSTRSFDMPYAVLTHEMAHEWTLPYAIVEGLPFLSEGLAWYFGIQAVKASRGVGQQRRLLRTLREPYPFRAIRRGQPLLRALDPYMAYRKGPLSMYALSGYVGDDRVNLALRRLIAAHDSPSDPKATTMDFYRELQVVTPDSLKPLLHDLFEINAFWQLRAERVSVVQKGDSAWQVILDVRARKMVYDSAGVETELPMNEWIDIGVFAAPEKAGDDAVSNPLYLRKHRVRSGVQTITVTVPRKPSVAGIDPYHLLDWEEPGDDNNIARVSGTPNE